MTMKIPTIKSRALDALVQLRVAQATTLVLHGRRFRHAACARLEQTADGVAHRSSTASAQLW